MAIAILIATKVNSDSDFEDTSNGSGNDSGKNYGNWKLLTITESDDDKN